MKNGFMKILRTSLVFLLFGVKPGFAASSELQNKLLDAIKANNPKQVELMIKSGANISFLKRVLTRQCLKRLLILSNMQIKA